MGEESFVESTPVILTATALDELDVRGGKSYLLDCTDLRKTRPEFYAMRSAIQTLRGQAETYLDEFFEKVREKQLTVCVIIHGFTSDHRAMEKKIGSLDSLKNNPDIVKLYIDWDTNVKTKTSLVFLQGTSRIITDGMNNAYDIHALVKKALQKHATRSKKSPEKGKLSVIVMAHSMGSHVAEAFIKEHESINLRAVIYFNPHADHTFYNLQQVDHLYTSHTKAKGFVLVFASSNDRVLTGSAILQKFVRSFVRTLFGGLFNLKNTYIRPLGCSWENYRDKATINGHRVAVLHMKHKPSFRFAFWYPFYDLLNHSSFNYTPCQEISNAAVNLAMTEDAFEIKQVLDLVQNQHLLEPEEDENGVVPPRPYGKAEEYVNMERENENTTIHLNNDAAKIKELNIGNQERVEEPVEEPLVESVEQSVEESVDESVVNETTPLTMT